MRLKAIHPDAKADLCDFHIPVMLFSFFINAHFLDLFFCKIQEESTKQFMRFAAEF